MPDAVHAVGIGSTTGVCRMMRAAGTMGVVDDSADVSSRYHLRQQLQSPIWNIQSRPHIQKFGIPIRVPSGASSQSYCPPPGRLLAVDCRHDVSCARDDVSLGRGAAEVE